jgi:hypothetical protein
MGEGIGTIDDAHALHVLAQTAFTSSFPIPLFTEVPHAVVCVWISVEQLHWPPIVHIMLLAIASTQMMSLLQVLCVQVYLGIAELNGQARTGKQASWSPSFSLQSGKFRLHVGVVSFIAVTKFSAHVPRAISTLPLVSFCKKTAT